MAEFARSPSKAARAVAAAVDCRASRSRLRHESAGEERVRQLMDARPQARRLADQQDMLDRSPRVRALETTGRTLNPEASAANRTGMPDGLKHGIESLSGLSMENVRVRRNSAEPGALGALAFARGNEIHLGPGQERHLPHEAWHVVQQRQGRVKPSLQAKGHAINMDSALEREADRQGRLAVGESARGSHHRAGMSEQAGGSGSAVTQCYFLVTDSKTPEKQVTNINFLPEEWEIDKDLVKPVRDVLMRWAKDGVEHKVANGKDAIAKAVDEVKKVGKQGPSDADLCQLAPRKKDASLLFPLIRKTLNTNSSNESLEEYGKILLPQLDMMYSKNEKMSESQVLEIFKQAIWVTYGKYFDQEEIGVKPGPKSLQTKKKTVEGHGFQIHFTNRTTDKDVELLKTVAATVATVVKEITPEDLAFEICHNSRGMMEQALRTKDEATGTKTDDKVIKEVAAEASDKLDWKVVGNYAVQAISRWRAALNGTIVLVVDRAGLKNVYGGSETDSTATPEKLMVSEGKVPQPKVRINLDSLGDDPAQVAIVIGHEVAHSLGFNPSLCDKSGHLKDSKDYATDEGKYGPKILFDAYYFETLIQRL